MFEKLANLLPKRDERISSARNTIKSALSVVDPELAESFKKMTPEQARYGRLISGLAEGAQSGNEGIEKAFDEWEKEYNKGEKLNILYRCLALFQTVETACNLNEETYRGVRKIAVQMLMTD